MEVFRAGRHVGRLTNIQSDLKYLEGEFSPDGTDEARQFLNDIESLDLHGIIREGDYEKGLKIELMDGSRGSEIWHVLSNKNNKLFARRGERNLSDRELFGSGSE